MMTMPWDLTRSYVEPGDLQKAKTHQIGARRNGKINKPNRQFEVRRYLIRIGKVINKYAAEGPDRERKKGATQQCEENDRLPGIFPDKIDDHIDAHVDALADTISRAKLCHPDEEINAQLLRPGQIESAKKLKNGPAALEHPIVAVGPAPVCGIDGGRQPISLHDGGENQKRRRRDQAADENLFEAVQYAYEQTRQ